jgi:hypothetical protein
VVLAVRSACPKRLVQAKKVKTGAITPVFHCANVK